MFRAKGSNVYTKSATHCVNCFSKCKSCHHRKYINKHKLVVAEKTEQIYLLISDSNKLSHLPY